MTVRHNLCTNPAAKNNLTGWGGDSTPVRVDATGEGLPRNTAARYTGGSFAQTPTGAVIGSQAYTLSAYVLNNGVGGGTNACYIEWTNGGGSHSYTSSTYVWTTNVVTRAWLTGTAPSDAVTASMILDGPNGSRIVDVTAALIEQAAALDTYFDGDTSPGGSWDGANGNSASTLSPGQTVILGQAVETDSALGIGTRLKARTLGQPAETDSALAIAGRAKKRTLGQALELDTAQPLQIAGVQINAVAIGPAERGWAIGPAERSWAIGPAEV